MSHEEKHRLRTRMRDLARQHGNRDSGAHCQIIRNLAAWNNAATILLYNPLPGEVDLLPLITVADSRTLLFPRIDGKTLQLYRWGPQSHWITGLFGLQEPDPETWQEASPEDIDLALIPGLAFDLLGGRLGRGGGFYDRLLGDADFHGIKIGLCWPWQVVDSVPSETHDIKMDLVISGKK